MHSYARVVGVGCVVVLCIVALLFCLNCNKRCKSVPSTDVALLPGNSSHTLETISQLEKRTGRKYACVIPPPTRSEIDDINIYLVRHPQTIPKRIHQIWIGHHKVPWKWINSFREKFRAAYPGWEHMLWREKDIKGLHLKNRKLYEGERTYCGKADILRYEILYQYGGIYIDADSEWLGTRDLGELIDSTNATGIFIGRECIKCKESLANSVIGCSTQNPIMGYTVQRMFQHYTSRDMCARRAAFKKTGPYFTDQMFRFFPITVFPYYYFYPVYWGGPPTAAKKYDLATLQRKYPNSYMAQYGFTTNNLKST